MGKGSWQRKRQCSDTEWSRRWAQWTTKFYKVLDENGSSCHGGRMAWNLPTDTGPGEWMPPIEGELVPCQNGYHLCRRGDLVDWIGLSLYEAEADGEVIECHDKVVVRNARLVRKLNWDNRTLVRFAADCAERALPLFEDEHPDDDRPRKAIAAARTDSALRAAVAATNAESAAEAAQSSASALAAYSAAHAARAADAIHYAYNATYAATSAIRVAARAVRAAAYAAGATTVYTCVSVAESAERQWQTDRLFEILQEAR